MLTVRLLWCWSSLWVSNSVLAQSSDCLPSQGAVRTRWRAQLQWMWGMIGDRRGIFSSSGPLLRSCQSTTVQSNTGWVVWKTYTVSETATSNLSVNSTRITLRRQSGKKSDSNKSVVVLRGFFICIIKRVFSRLEKSGVKHFLDTCTNTCVTCEESPKTNFHLFLSVLKIVWIFQPSCVDSWNYMDSWNFWTQVLTHVFFDCLNVCKNMCSSSEKKLKRYVLYFWYPHK